MTKSLDIVCIDFQKAFDKAPHHKLLYRLKQIGIHGQLHQWIANCLRNRQQRVVTDGFNSEWAPVASGIPQGSVFGSVLFIIYINDVDVGLNDCISKFADDTKIGKSVLTNEDRQSRQEDLHKISAWSDRWEMPFNVDKCQVLQVGTRKKKLDYETRGIKVTRV